jgi:hypothetical protein
MEFEVRNDLHVLICEGCIEGGQLKLKVESFTKLFKLLREVPGYSIYFVTFEVLKTNLQGMFLDKLLNVHRTEWTGICTIIASWWIKWNCFLGIVFECY